MENLIKTQLNFKDLARISVALGNQIENFKETTGPDLEPGVQHIVDDLQETMEKVDRMILEIRGID